MPRITRILNLFYPPCQSNKYELMFQDLAKGGSTPCQFCTYSAHYSAIFSSPLPNSTVLVLETMCLLLPKLWASGGQDPGQTHFCLCLAQYLAHLDIQSLFAE